MHVRVIPSSVAIYGQIDPSLPAKLSAALRNIGIEKLYTHQCTAIEHARNNRNFVVCTSTASGKTLCYNLPVVESIELDPNAKAIYIFPTKALAQDQMRQISELELDLVKAYTYDGDTPKRERPFIKSVANIILTNPDMLHRAILPYHSSWASFFRDLKYVVIDELHAYTGVFGAHVALIMRRLRLIAKLYGSKPVFICSSATLREPAMHAQSITGLPMQTVDNDGSPRGKKTILFWNPPYLEESNERVSANVETVNLFVRLLKTSCRTLVFARARKTAEIILKHTTRRLKSANSDIFMRVASYRGGYLPEQRREIEHKLFEGELLGVASTNALELGVDIGGLDAVILSGYPGTVVSTMQQIGRAGREKQESLAILVGRDDPMDQYIMHNPDYLVGPSNERVVVNLSNPYILGPQLACALSEQPLTPQQIGDYFGDAAWGAIGELHRKGVADFRQLWYWTGSESPAQDINIRSTGSEMFTIIAIEERPYELGTTDMQSAFEMLHPGAVYLHAGESYVVNKLDIEQHIAFVEKSSVDYYTVAGECVRADVLGTDNTNRLAFADIRYGDIEVVSQVNHYWRKKLYTEQRIARVPLQLPEVALQTKAVWFELDSHVMERLSSLGRDVIGSLHAAEHLLIGVLPILAICDRNDIGGVSTQSHVDCKGKAAIFVYDGHSGGIGIAEYAYHSIRDWLQTAKQSLEQCSCEDGCPSCVQSPKCGNDNQPLDKQGAKTIIDFLLESP